MNTNKAANPPDWHRRLIENKGGLMAVLSVAAIAVGSLVELVPMFTLEFEPREIEHVTPYTPLEVAGRDIYIREGCYLCHSQWVRPFRSETLRYGEWSRASEYAYDQPFQLGSRRIGPDLHRVGGKYNDAWHYEHMKDPRSTSPGSIMPPYKWLYDASWSGDDIDASVAGLITLGQPFPQEQAGNPQAHAFKQAKAISEGLKEFDIEVSADKEIVALIAYLQRLGQDSKAMAEARAAAEGGE